MKSWGIRTVSRVCFLALTTLWPMVVLADGMVIPQIAYAIPDIPDQRALLHYADGTETLVIETSFTGRGTNFAWVVPLPAVARIEPVTAGLFPTLQTIFQPEVVLSVKHYWIVLPIAALVIWLMGLVRRRGSYAFLVVFCILLLAAVVLLPALTAARSKGGASDSITANVRVLNRQSAGLFDTVTIKSADPAALVGWLNQNGFRVPTNIAPVLAYYAGAGWVFAAARLHSAAEEHAPRATHPLAFTFKTIKPVYPLRLTGAATASCRVDLYVFGPGRATAPGFTAQRCEAPKYDASDMRPRLKAGDLRIRHHELAKLVAGAPVATKLSAVLDSAGMARDAYVDWGSYRHTGQKLYSPGAALILSGNVSALLFMALVLGWWLLSRAKLGFQPLKWGPWLAPVALAAGMIVYFLGLPKIGASSLKLAEVSYGRAWNDCYVLSMALQDEMGDSNVIPTTATSPHPLTSAEMERLLQFTIRDYRGQWSHYLHIHPSTNFFTSERIRLEASPGNVILRPAQQDYSMVENRSVGGAQAAYELVWHDLDGAEAITNLVIQGSVLK